MLEAAETETMNRQDSSPMRPIGDMALCAYWTSLLVLFYLQQPPTVSVNPNADRKQSGCTR